MIYQRNLKLGNEKLKNKIINEVSIFPQIKPVIKFVFLLMTTGN